MKRRMKIIGIVLLCVVGAMILLIAGLTLKNTIERNKPWLSDNYYTHKNYEMPLEQIYSGLGHYEVKQVVYKFHEKTMENIRIWYPSEMETVDTKYPMIIAVNGSNTAALNYEPFFSRLASW